MSNKRFFTSWPWQRQPDATNDAEFIPTNGNAEPDASNERSNGTDRNATIKCLLALRSVRDQAGDADLLTGELEHKLIFLENGLIDHLARQREQQDGLGLLTVSVVGDFNSGKSTFINALMGMDICPVGDKPTTASVTYFIPGAQERIEQELEDGKRVPLEKSKYRALACHKKEGDNKPHIFHISINSPILEHIRLVDTPGFNAPPPNTNDTRVTQSAVVESDVLFVLMDINKGNPSDTLLDQLDQLSQNSANGSRQLAFLLLNKAEALPPSQRTEVKRVCMEQHEDRFRDVVLVSALQLNESEDEEPLDALDIAMRRMRSAYKARDSFKENISAELTPQSYRLDISGNVYDVPASSDFELASRGQLADMVKSVSAERHDLLERQFQRNTLQLREDWQTTLSMLDQALKRALSESSRVGDGHNETKRKETALEAIEKAKDETLSLVSEIFQETPDEIVVKDQRTEEGFWGDRVYYQVRVYSDKAYQVMDVHDNWHRIYEVYKGLLSFLKMSLDIDCSPTPQQFVEDLKECSLDLIRVTQEAVKQVFQKLQEDDDWEYKKKRKFWKCEYEDDQDSRDQHFDLIRPSLVSSEKEDILNLTQHIQEVIDRLNKEVISTTERNQSQVEERTEELQKLQERIKDMKEHTP